MKILIKDIKIDRSNEATKRIRKDFGDIQELVQSIKKHGLIHPIVVDEIIELVQTEKEKRFQIHSRSR